MIAPLYTFVKFFLRLSLHCLPLFPLQLGRRQHLYEKKAGILKDICLTSIIDLGLLSHIYYNHKYPDYSSMPALMCLHI